MKKTLIILSVFLLLISIISTVNAATVDDILTYAKKTHTVAGESYTLPSSEIVKIERYFEQYPISATNGDALIGKLDQIKAKMEAEGVADPAKLSAIAKNEVVALATEAASIAGATLNVNTSSNTVTISRDGKVIETISLNQGKLAYTGANRDIIIVSGIALAAVVAIIISKRGIKVNA